MSVGSSLGEFERSHLAKTLVRAVGSAVLLVVLYYVFPIEHRVHQSVALRLSAALIIFTVVLAIEVRQIAKHDQPMLRAGVAMSTIIPLFLIVFAVGLLDDVHLESRIIRSAPHPDQRPLFHHHRLLDRRLR